MYKMIQHADGSYSKTERTTWKAISSVIPSSILGDAKSALKGTDGRFTVFTANVGSEKIFLSGSSDGLNKIALNSYLQKYYEKRLRKG